MGFIKYLTENITLYKIFKEIGSFIVVGLIATLIVLVPAFLFISLLSFILWSGSYFATDINFEAIANLPNMLSMQDSISLSLGVVLVLFLMFIVFIVLWLIIIKPIKKKYKEYKREIEYKKLHEKE